MISAATLSARARGVPLRVRLVAAVLALVAAALVVISALTAFFLHNYLIGQVDTELRLSVHGLQSLPTNRPVTVGLPTDYMAVVITPTGQVDRVAYDDTRFGSDDLPPWPSDAAGFARLKGDPFTVR
ncbi:MAG TPA: two-component sensor histidine kinase, partial [Micromonosporaceae bacterium]|nr:two-component sensor histidine kinase [Micromonosporaceae bacterium]